MKDQQWYVPPDCRYCHGKGWTWVQNGPDDVDKDPCDCWVERSTMGKELATYPSKSSPGVNYSIIEAADGTPYCDCRGWKMSPAPKTCRHLKDYLSRGDGTGSPIPTPVVNPGELKPVTCEGAEKGEVENVIDNIINKFALKK